MDKNKYIKPDVLELNYSEPIMGIALGSTGMNPSETESKVDLSMEENDDKHIVENYNPWED